MLLESLGDSLITLNELLKAIVDACVLFGGDISNREVPYAGVETKLRESIVISDELFELLNGLCGSGHHNG